MGTELTSVTLEVSDGGQLAALQELLTLDPRLQVTREPGLPQAGHLGPMDVLTVTAGGGGLVAALRVLPEFIRSRRSRLSITVTCGDMQVTVDADNIPDAQAMLEKLLNG